VVRSIVLTSFDILPTSVAFLWLLKSSICDP